MSNNAIEIENLWKKYRLGEKQTSDMIRDIISNPFQKSKFKSKNEFWALKDINLQVKEGEVLGVIGKNGSGKSTLLKILSRITPPTKGNIKMNGRVASLLEVGTGFSGELTGRENIFLNGSILGMTKNEIKRKFDEIVDFSGVEKFIDTPVKRYSSGMYVRLAFAVAANLESEILIVDEVLAVGDAEFQKKCLGKMQSMTKSGRTVLFVSHNMGAVNKLCNNALLLNKGKLAYFGTTQKTIDKYLNTHQPNQTKISFPYQSNSPASITEVQILSSIKQPIDNIYIDKDFYLSIKFTVNQTLPKAMVGVDINSADIKVLTSSQADTDGKISFYKKGKYQAQIRIPAFYLNVGEYYLDIVIHNPYIESFDRKEGVFVRIQDRNNPRTDLYRGNIHGITALTLEYNINKI